MPINWWIYNLIMPYSHNELAFTNKRNQLLTHKTMCMNLKSILLNEWSQSKMETPCLFPKVKGQCLVTYLAVLLCCAKSLQMCLTLCSPMDLTCQAPLSRGFSRQEYWSCYTLLQGNLPNPGIEPPPLLYPALAVRFFITSTTWEALFSYEES